MESLTQNECEVVTAFFLGTSIAKDFRMNSIFLEYYEKLTMRWRTRSSGIEQRGLMLTSDKQVRDLVTMLRENPSLNRQDFEYAIWPQGCSSRKEELELRSVVVTVVCLGFMLHCSCKECHARGHHIGMWSPPQWEPGNYQSLEEFITSSIPKQSSALHEPQDHFMLLSAWKLTKRCKIKIKATDYLDEHLLYVPKHRELRVFRQILWARAQLEQCRSSSNSAALSSSINGNLSKITADNTSSTTLDQLMIEVLESFHRILFSWKDDENGQSTDILTQLIRDESFDSSASNQNYVNLIPLAGVRYIYLRDRLQILSDLMRSPPPANKFMAWMESKASERFTLTIAITALVLSVFFGMLSCIIGIIQVVLQFYAWKYPVNSGWQE